VLGATAVLAFCGARAQAQEANSGATYREVTDETGRHVNVPQPVRRIVSLAPNLTEIIYALEAQDWLVGDTDYCDYPSEAQKKTKVGGVINPNLEEIVALKPDLVLATAASNRRETVVALEGLGVATYATDPRSVENMLSSIVHLADVLGIRERGEALAAKLRDRLADLSRRLDDLAPKRALFIVWMDPLISTGRENFLTDAMRWAGGRSIVDSSQEWPRLSLEEVVKLQPDYLVVAASHGNSSEAGEASFRELPGWRSLEAVRQNHIAVVSDTINRPAPRMIDAIVELARQLHPEAFADQRENRNPQGQDSYDDGIAQQEPPSCAR